MLKFSWNETALTFIHRTLPAFPDALQAAGGRFVHDIFANRVLPLAKQKSPVFSGDMRDDLDFTPLVTESIGKSYWWLGESGKLAIGAEDTHKHPAPFSYPLARHDGAEGHLVYLYATNTYARKKLRRWVREKLYVALPETKEEAELLRASGEYVPLSLWVNPMYSYSQYQFGFLYGTLGGVPHYIMSGARMALRGLTGELDRYWR